MEQPDPAVRPLVGLIMGSKSDWEYLQPAAEVLTELGVPFEARVVSAHRTPDFMFEYAESAEERGLLVIIAAAGGAAHLPGMVAAKTLVPVLGVPVPATRATRGGCPALHRPDAEGRPGGDAGHRQARGGQRRRCWPRRLSPCSTRRFASGSGPGAKRAPGEACESELP